MDNITLDQQVVLAALEKRGFDVNSHEFYPDEVAPTIFMSKQVRHSMRYAEIGPDAKVNGLELGAFFDTLENYKPS